MTEGSGRWAQEADAEHLACYWEDTRAGNPSDHDADLTKSRQPNKVSGDSLFEAIPGAGGPGPTNES